MTPLSDGHFGCQRIGRFVSGYLHPLGSPTTSFQSSVAFGLWLPFDARNLRPVISSMDWAKPVPLYSIGFAS